MKRIISLSLLILLIIAQTSCANLDVSKNEPVSKEEFMLDTICSISVYRMKDAKGDETDAANVNDEAESAIDEAFALCDELEHKLSRTIAGSDVSHINSAKGEWSEVSNETLELIQKGMEYSDISDGDFDITCGGITGLWDFHAAEGKEKLPDEAALTEAVKHINYKNVEIDEKGGRVRLPDPDAKLDLGGIAKGYIGDKMAEILEEAGVSSGIINLGGNVICIGGKSESEDFVIGVEAPFSDRSEIIGKVNARNKTLVTSGIYERKLEIDGKIYHHILDTETGWPVDTDLDAVTLIVDKGRSADIDALSTICLIKGADEAMSLIEKTDGVEGIFVLRDGSVRASENAVYEEVER